MSGGSMKFFLQAYFLDFDENADLKLDAGELAYQRDGHPVPVPSRLVRTSPSTPGCGDLAARTDQGRTTRTDRVLSFCSRAQKADPG